VQFEFLSYQQAFTDFVSINPHQTTSAECYQAAKLNNIEIPQGLRQTDEVDDWLDWLLTQQILPAFKKDRFTFLYNYPASQCALAKVAKNEQQVSVAKRFELFFGETELANGFHELTDANEQLQRFKKENKARIKAGLDCGHIDENFIAALRSGLPECSGVAVGLDRLLMVLAKAAHIEQVISFPWGKA
jgi:lysyl-tRNA synthetase class 2